MTGNTTENGGTGFCVGRRRFGALVMQAAAFGALPWAARADTSPSLKGSKVVFASWGGMYQNAQKAAFCEPFAKATGAVVIQDGPVDYTDRKSVV